MAVVGRVLSMPNQAAMGTPIGMPQYGKPIMPQQPLQPYQQKAEYAGYLAQQAQQQQGQNYGRPLGMPIHPQPARMIPRDDEEDDDDNNVEVVSHGYGIKTMSGNLSASFASEVDANGYNCNAHPFAYGMQQQNHYSNQYNYGYGYQQQYASPQGAGSYGANGYYQSPHEGSWGGSSGYGQTLGYTTSQSSLSDHARCYEHTVSVGSLNSSMHDNASHSVRSSHRSSSEPQEVHSLHDDDVATDLHYDDSAHSAECSSMPSPRGRSEARSDARSGRSRSMESTRADRPSRAPRSVSLEPVRSFA